MPKTPKTEAPKRPRGRPAVANKRTNLTIRVTDEERERFEAVGGADWFRAALKRARVPDPAAPAAPAARVPTSCSACDFDEAEGDLLSQCPRCMAADRARRVSGEAVR